jgi:hypothetical protein
VTAAALLIIAARDARAYLDPGTGSFIIQILVAGLLGIGFAVKIFWRQIRHGFSKLFSRSREPHDDDS